MVNAPKHSLEYVGERLDEHTVVLGKLIDKVDDLRNWKSQVIGIGIGISLTTSIAYQVVTHFFVPRSADAAIVRMK